MTDGPVDVTAVTAALIAEGLQVVPDEARRIWDLSFEVLAHKQPVLLMLPPSEDYFWAIAPIQSPALAVPVDRLSAETLRTIIKLQSEKLLAKFNVFRDGAQTLYTTVSPCSAVKWDGTKLRRRLQACAELAAQIRLALQAPREE